MNYNNCYNGYKSINPAFTRFNNAENYPKPFTMF